MFKVLGLHRSGNTGDGLPQEILTEVTPTLRKGAFQEDTNRTFERLGIQERASRILLRLAQEPRIADRVARADDQIQLRAACLSTQLRTIRQTEQLSQKSWRRQTHF